MGVSGQSMGYSIDHLPNWEIRPSTREAQGLGKSEGPRSENRCAARRGKQAMRRFKGLRIRQGMSNDDYNTSTLCNKCINRNVELISTSREPVMGGCQGLARASN